MTSPAPATKPVPEFFAGFGVLLQGFHVWRRRPGLMALGLVPALIVAAVLGTLLIVVLLNIDGIAAFVTPFADAWDASMRRILRLGVSLAIVAGVVILAVFGFTGLTLLVGDPFYERIWREVENELGGLPETSGPGFWRTVRDALALGLKALGTAMLVALVGLIPVVGAPVAAVLGLLVSGRLIARELTARPLEARGLTAGDRVRVLRARSARVTGFGVAVNLCFLVPGGAIVAMSAAVAGATFLARDALEAHAARSVPPDPATRR